MINVLAQNLVEKLQNEVSQDDTVVFFLHSDDDDFINKLYKLGDSVNCRKLR